MVLEQFAAAHPSRFVNVGVAEANMIGVATGLASMGFLPFCYSIATFASMRCYEQIRNGPVAHGLPVRIVGVGGGFAYGSAGITHHALEDLALARAQPDLAVIAPADDSQAEAALRSTYDQPGPAYYRLTKSSITIPELAGRFRIGRLETVGEGSDVLLLATGAISASVVAAADVLAKRGIRGTVGIAASINPPPTDDLAALLRRFALAMSIEDHYRVGGLGSLVAEVIADNGLAVRLVRRGVASKSTGPSGSEQYLRAQAQLSVEQLAEAVSEALQCRAAPSP